VAANREARWVEPRLSLKVRRLAFGTGLLRQGLPSSYTCRAYADVTPMQPRFSPLL